MVDVDQFFGIDLGEFPAHIAEVALWMMDHIMNNRLSLEFGQTYVRVFRWRNRRISGRPTRSSSIGRELLPTGGMFLRARQSPICGREVSIARTARTSAPTSPRWARAAARSTTSPRGLSKLGNTYKNSTARIGFVATNSITQGEQVAQLWPILFERHKLDIAFAHRTFAWGSDARGMAHVHVVIIGLAKRDDALRQKRLFSYDSPKSDPQQSQHTALSPYLFDASGLTDPGVVVREAHLPINGLPKLIIGSKPIDGGHYIFKVDERATFLREEPGAEPYLRPFVGSREFLQGGERWILHLADVPPHVLKNTAESARADRRCARV